MLLKSNIQEQKGSAITNLRMRLNKSYSTITSRNYNVCRFFSILVVPPLWFHRGSTGKNTVRCFLFQFILTFRLAIDASLYQKHRTQGEKQTLSESSKNNS